MHKSIHSYSFSRVMASLLASLTWLSSFPSSPPATVDALRNGHLLANMLTQVCERSFGNFDNRMDVDGQRITNIIIDEHQEKINVLENKNHDSLLLQKNPMESTSFQTNKKNLSNHDIFMSDGRTQENHSNFMANRISNLRELIMGMELVLGEHYGWKVNILEQINVSAIVTLQEEDAIPLVLELVKYAILCAVNSKKREEAVGKILALEESMQHEMMVMIHTGMEMFQPGGLHFPESGSGLNNTVLVSPKHKKKPSVHEDNDVIELRQQLDSLRREHRELKILYHGAVEQLNIVTDDMERKLTNVTASTQQELTAQYEAEIGKLKKALEKSEGVTADQVSNAQMAIESAETRAKVVEQELNSKLKEIRVLQDELDIAQDKLKSTVQLENTIARLKTKLEESGDTHRRLQVSESFAAEKQSKVMELENEVQKLNVQKVSLQKYRDQSLAMEVELSQLKDSLTLKSSEAAKFKALYDDQGARLRDLTAQLEQSQHTVPQQQGASIGDTLADLNTQAQLSALQVENKRLTLDWEKVAQMEEELSVAKKRYELSQTQIVSQSKTIQDLSEKISELESQPAASAVSTSQLELMNSRISKLQHYEQVAHELTEQNMTLHGDVDSLQSAVKSLNTKYISEREKTDNHTNEVTSLKAQLEASKQKGDKLEKKVAQLTETIKKAQVEVNKNFDAIKKQFASHSQQRMQKMQQTYDQTISDLQVALKAKEDEIAVINKLRIEQRDMFKQEQALMSSAFYEIGMEMSRMWSLNPSHNVGSNSDNSSGGVSWLAAQRATGSRC